MKDLNNPLERGDIVFVEVDDIIFLLSVVFLKYLQDHKDEYDKYFDYSKFENMNGDNLTRLCIQRTDRNILKWIAKDKELNFDFLYARLMPELSKYLGECPVGILGESIIKFLHDKVFKEIILYYPVNDPRIVAMVCELFDNSDKITFAYGDPIQIIKNHRNIDAFFISDGELANKIFDENLMEYKEMCLADCGYNLINRDGKPDSVVDFEFRRKNLQPFKFGMMVPIQFADKHFTDIRF